MENVDQRLRIHAETIAADIAKSIESLRDLKSKHPALRTAYYEGSPGSILNAYREGDLTFNEAVKALNELTVVAASARKLDLFKSAFVPDENYVAELSGPTVLYVRLNENVYRVENMEGENQ